jgi:hypothetical protein
MSNKSKTAALIGSFLLLAAIGAGGFWFLQKTEPHLCPICQRSIHPYSRAVFLSGKTKVAVCCVRCGVTHNVQAGKPGDLIEVTEFLSNHPMKPDAAFYVEGSKISLCDPHSSNLMDETKHPYSRTFDRCEPSTYAFAHQRDAEAFARANGGKILNWDDLRKEAAGQP